MAQFCTCDKQIVVVALFFLPSTCKHHLTSTVRNTAELIPSAISYSPFSFGLVKLYSLPGPNILIKRNNIYLSAQVYLNTFILESNRCCHYTNECCLLHQLAPTFKLHYRELSNFSYGRVSEDQQEEDRELSFSALWKGIYQLRTDVLLTNTATTWREGKGRLCLARSAHCLKEVDRRGNVI